MKIDRRNKQKNAVTQELRGLTHAHALYLPPLGKGRITVINKDYKLSDLIIILLLSFKSISKKKKKKKLV